MQSPQAHIEALERAAVPAAGAGEGGAGDAERFTGFGVTGVPFSSGHVLALRRFPASSIGPGYTSVWIRDPAGAWSMHGTVDPGLSCPRYFGAALESASTSRISLAWGGGHAITIDVDGGDVLHWDLMLRATPVTRIMSAVSGSVPERLLRRRTFLHAMGAVAGPALGAGRLRLTGHVPNGQRFAVYPRRLWFVAGSRAVLEGLDLGEPAALTVQDRLGDFWIPRRGILMAGTAVFEPGA
ncbi:hypothetical protein ACFVTM_09840 [Arthrobacter sp. NPDC058130]|uniref:hypothetical protein n=1 Tax=Arthrobacter sp. NPDC058130 TaxID=3346353 RepID=UPI0036E15C83